MKQRNAQSVGLPLGYHNCGDTMVYGACRQGEMHGVFTGRIFIGHRCICMPVHLYMEELRAKEDKFLREDPEW